MLQISGGDQDRLHAQVMLDKKIFQLPAVHAANGVEPPQDRVAQGVAGPEGFAEEIVDVFIRGVLDHVDLLDDHLPFFFQLFHRETGIEKKIEKEV